MKCSDVMTSMYGVNDNVGRAALLMSAQDFNSNPMTAQQSKKLFGIMTDGEQTLTVLGEPRNFQNTRIEEVMTCKPVMYYPDEEFSKTIDELANLEAWES